MKLFLIGGTGNIGKEILAEALQRGHDVTALARDPSKYEAKPKLKVVQGDILDAAKLADQVRGHDAIVVSYNPGWTNPEAEQQTLDGAQNVIEAAKRGGVKRAFWVGGASSLQTADGPELFSTIDPAKTPPAVYGAIRGLREVFHRLQKMTDIDWTFFSPAGEIAEGPRTGTFRLGKDQMVVGPDGKSRISRADYAIAVIDELERPQHIRQRFTIGY